MTPKTLAIESPVQPPAAQVPATGQHALAPVRVRGMRRPLRHAVIRECADRGQAARSPF